MAYTTRLGGGDANFQGMMKNGFGIVTVMNALVFNAPEAEVLKGMTAYDVVENYTEKDAICKLDTLKVANVTQEGPSKTVTGGQYSNPLIKFGKSARLEMQDALGRADAIEAFGGAINEYASNGGLMTGMHVTEDFAPARLIVGESFFIDRKTGRQVKVDVIFYQVLPDSIFNLTQDAEGDATVFDMNADLLTTEILVGHNDNEEYTHGVFYSIIEHAETSNAWVVDPKTLAVTKNGVAVETGITYSEDGSVWSGTKPTVTAGKVYNIRVSENGVVVYSARVTAAK